MQSALEAQKVLRWLMIVRWIALADLILLIVLLVASFANNEELVQIFGLTYGIVFLALIAIVGIGALQKLWSWWFFVATLITTPSRRFGWGIPNCAQSQSHPRDIDRGYFRPIVNRVDYRHIVNRRRDTNGFSFRSGQDMARSFC